MSPLGLKIESLRLGACKTLCLVRRGRAGRQRTGFRQPRADLHQNFAEEVQTLPLAHVSDPWIIPRQAHAIDSVVWTGLGTENRGGPRCPTRQNGVVRKIT